jgi:hypothetical protein
MDFEYYRGADSESYYAYLPFGTYCPPEFQCSTEDRLFYHYGFDLNPICIFAFPLPFVTFRNALIISAIIVFYASITVFLSCSCSIISFYVSSRLFGIVVPLYTPFLFNIAA